MDVELEAMFDYLNCEDWLMFTGPMFMPQDEAHMSSKSAKASEVHAKELIMWTKFKDLLQKYYFLETVINDRETKFLHLKKH